MYYQRQTYTTVTKGKQNERRILLAQLNTLRRLQHKMEIKRYWGTTEQLRADVVREYKK